MKVEDAVKTILKSMGEKPDREGLQGTPERVTKLYKELTHGYQEDPHDVVNDAIYTIDYDEMVIVKDIEYYSLCEHHILPFFGKCHVAYIPQNKVIGLSKIPRVVEVYARRLQVQERMTVQIANFLNGILKPKGVAVVVNGFHLCMAMRGIMKADANMLTSSMLGSFRKDERTRMEFLSLINQKSEK
ncbi:MAG: GTP cyclohydrolase I FolE [Thermodesulfobacteriota bacterium]